MSGVKPIDTVLGKERDATYAQCETTAKDILGDGYAVASVENQESQSYTFVGTPTIPKAIVSFRLEPGKFDPEILKIARDIHGGPVPDAAAPCGYIAPRPGGGGQSLTIYKMSCLPGRDFWSLVEREAQLDEAEAVAKRHTLVRSLAR